MRPIDLNGVTWRKSSYSNTSGGQCVEVATHGHRQHHDAPALVPVRDSKDPGRTPLVFGAAAWGAFIGAVRVGGFGA
ncbi:DUF397 domain-containing protein [Streptomyces sp. RS10V-4]|uniref:DUF397 domain-containing protein n=1 Tax=Streptomyces rhizoryzae TaxID=2932493 RepID=UPI0020045779|nr:DUF397 domain-containing protein [Streptomyces rhizoryzae]MCK7627331.1 DUF397 domain-containing protein [Streptomyces rhizoryzae]